MFTIKQKFVFAIACGVATSLVIWFTVIKFIFFIPVLHDMWTTVLYLAVPVLGGGFVGGLISSSSKSLCGLYTGLIAYVIFYLISPINSYGNQFQVFISAILFILFGGLLGFLGALLSYKRFLPVLSSVAIIGIGITIISLTIKPFDPENHNLYDKGYSSSDTGFMSDFIKALNDSDLDFNIYTRDGNEFVGYRREDEAGIKKIIERVEEERHKRIYGRPKDYVEYCSYDGSLSSVIESLNNEKIDYHMVSNNCIAWSRDYDDLLHEINPRLKTLKDAEIQYDNK